MAHKIQLGQKVRCKVTGMEGIAITRVEYLNGCVQYAVKGKVDKKTGKVPESEFGTHAGVLYCYNTVLFGCASRFAYQWDGTNWAGSQVPYPIETHVSINS